ncbi:MFS transporter [Rhodococcus sp. NPDC056960]|uniref:MFS transporter n=1 Tax=Rhodococcus sp. NPDC056960 TaxID=3345982 RepID=UPI0036367C42
MSIEDSTVTQPPTRTVRLDSHTRRRAWAVTAMLILFILINFADKAVLGLAAKPIMEDLGLTASQYGVISSAFFLPFTISAVVGGFLSDRFPTKWVILGMVMIWTVMMLPMIGTVGFVVLLISRLVLGAAEGPAAPVAIHAIHKWFTDSERSLPTSLFALGAPLGVIVAAPVIGWVIEAFSWHAAFGLLAAVGFVWALAWIVIGREGTVDHRPSDDRSATDLQVKPTVRIPLRRIISTPTWLAATAATFAGYWSMSLLIAWVPPYLGTVGGYGSGTVGLLVTLPWLAGGVGVLLQGMVTTAMMRRGVSSRKARGVLGSGCLLVSGIAMAGVVYAAVGWPQIAFMTFAFYFGSVIISAVTLTVNAELSPASQRGSVQGTTIAVSSLAGVIAPFVAGRIIQAHDGATGYQIVFLLTAGILVTGGIIAMLWIRPERDIRALSAYAA